MFDEESGKSLSQDLSYANKQFYNDKIKCLLLK